jgi:hypothetical protein
MNYCMTRSSAGAKRGAAAAAATDAGGDSAGAAGSKVLHLMRHGTTEMNVYLSRPGPKHRYGGLGFVDPLE